MWSRVSTVGRVQPDARFFHSCAAVNDQILVFGGSTLSGALYNDFWSFNVSRQEWSQLPILNVTNGARAGHVATVFENKYFVFGGTTQKQILLNDTCLFSIDISNKPNQRMII